MNMTKAVIFDLWSTLAYNARENHIIKRIFDSIGIDGYDKENQRKMEESFMTKRFETAEEAMEEFCATFGKGNKCAHDLAGIWNDLNVRIYDDVIPALRKLREEGYKAGLITNTQSFALKQFEEIKFFDEFDYCTFSYDVGLLKPDPRIFRHSLERLDVKAEDAVMVGDNLRADVKGAEAVGMKGVLIKRPNKENLAWNERGHWKRTITGLDQLRQYL
jgi:putative hydrolase of the HAD superfamily